MKSGWIKIEKTLIDKPEVAAMAEALGLDEFSVSGRLMALWSWADDHADEDGFIPLVRKSRIDRIAAVDGFADAMIAVGWLAEEPDGVVFPGYSEHNGTTAKTRARTAKRVQQHREKEEKRAKKQTFPRGLKKKIRDRDSATCVYCGRAEGQTHPTESPTNGYMCLDHVIPESRGGETLEENLVCCCNKCNREKANRTPDEAGMRWPEDVTGKRYGGNKKPLPDKSREEKSKDTPLTPRAGGSSPDLPGFGRWWAAYPGKKAERAKCLAYWTGKAATRGGKQALEPQADQIIDALKLQVAAKHFRGNDGADYIPHPKTWLYNCRWEDEVAHAPVSSPDGLIAPYEPTFEESRRMMGGGDED